MRRVSSYPKDLDQVVKLPMDVAYDCYGRRDVDDVALAHEELFGLFADLLEEGFPEELLAEQSRDAGVEVEGHGDGAGRRRSGTVWEEETLVLCGEESCLWPILGIEVSEMRRVACVEDEGAKSSAVELAVAAQVAMVWMKLFAQSGTTPQWYQ